MSTTLDHIAPDVAQAVVAQAAARGLSANDYLRHLLGLAVIEPAPAAAEAELLPRDEEQPQRNEAMFAALQRSAERLKDRPVSGSTEQTLKIIREGRAGAMYGYEPTDTE
jgi:hypothetical protein